MYSKGEINPPRFWLEGYAIYDDEKYIKLDDGKVFCLKGLDFIGVKPDAPQWAKDEYKQWLETQAEAKKRGIKL